MNVKNDSGGLASKAESAPSQPADATAPNIASASIPETLAALHVNPETGLTRAEADARLKARGYNEVTERKEHPVLKFLGKFWGLSAWMLEAIMLLSLVLSSGSLVRRGEGNGVVLLTGVNTYFGRTTQLVQIARPKLHIEAVIARLVRWLFVIVGSLLAVVIVTSLIRGTPLLEMLPLMLVLLSSAAPMALPVMFTVSMASETAAKGYRTLAVARGAETGDPTMVGLATLYDPPRPDAKPLIAALHDLGVQVKMLTGDALAIAQEIAQGVGLPNIRRVADLKAASARAGNAAVDLLAGADGFAEVFPEDKYVVVRQLQAAGHVVGMTGDGVNDAPALRQAEVGIAVSTATDVAKGAASVVLTEPGLTNIVALVKQGRVIYQHVLTWIINKISSTILKSTFVAIAFLATGKFVVSASAMLLLVFLMDFATIALATDYVRPSRRPETWAIGGFVAVSVVLGLAMVVETLVLLWMGWSRFGLATDANALYTFSFLVLLFFGALSSVSRRERRWFWSTRPSTPLLAGLTAGVLVGAILTRVGLPGLPPLPWSQTLGIFAYAAVSCLVVNDAVKVMMIRRLVPAAVA
jgi:magnesium-transporting ATPase (P-type)